jgi:hypothetical protein
MREQRVSYVQSWEIKIRGRRDGSADRETIGHWADCSAGVVLGARGGNLHLCWLPAVLLAVNGLPKTATLAQVPADSADASQSEPALPLC